MTFYYQALCAGAGLCLLLLSGCFNSAEPINEAASESSTVKPNIIYILADDLGYGDLSCYGQTRFSTPNIDRLAANGMLFTQHYSGATVCAPSRSALLTGQHTGHTFIRGNYEIQPEGQYPIPDETNTMAEALKDAGYVTGAFGKWGLGYPGSEGDPNKQGFDTFYGFNCQRLGHHYYPDHLWSNQDSIVLEGNSGLNKESYAPDMIHDQTMAFLEEHKDTSFFLYVPSIIPHAELIAPDSILAEYEGNFQPEKPYEGVDSGPEYRKGKYGSQPTPHAAFVAMIRILDRQVGEIVQRVEELGIADNTLIIFTSDNGPHREGGADPDYFDSNGIYRGTKRDLYEGGIHVPMIASWPGKIEAGSRTDHVSAFWDVFPTLANLAGAEPPSATDGISMVPTLLGQGEQEQHEYLYWEFHEKGGRQAVRKGDWKAVRYNVKKNPDSNVQLYNLKNDPGEKTDIALEHPAVEQELRLIMDNARTPSEVFSFGQEAYKGD
ncbi:arylsulfatase [Neolewinella aurantiaca]|uniref:Arylsulfatase n=1 Tax=Neolewinella aurantiaca TaxID=2602767 RepID=A0A5C7FET3_9BACT|nr:arylsulfatase [Neolewinella aurantiaca]TXF88048.1 arylsulfatase [Neolewinella aurantiaca]